MTNEETRSCTEIEQELRRSLADNTMLRTQVAQMRQAIADYERAGAVEVDVEFARFMYGRGKFDAPYHTMGTTSETEEGLQIAIRVWNGR